VIETFVGLGSNLGDRLGNLGTAVSQLAREPGLVLRKVSLAYESEPVGPPQPRYLNAVAQIGTLLSPRATLQRLQSVEDAMGRVRREHWGSREIDLDLLLYADRVLRETGLLIPHPLLAERAFVLAPLAEIAPEVVHPIRRLTARQLLEALSPEERGGIQPFRPIRPPLPPAEGEEEPQPP
jgi:2-amino-4-hydroxy-6-hydroxymethyldihydropteridine diphosphokinase